MDNDVVMPDLVVTQDLEDSQTNLATIDDEFKNASDRMHQNAGIWGQSDLAHAMWDFVDDWWIHREKIEKSLGELKDNVDEAVKAWDDTEQNLKQGITVQNQGTVSGPGR